MSETALGDIGDDRSVNILIMSNSVKIQRLSGTTLTWVVAVSSEST